MPNTTVTKPSKPVVPKPYLEFKYCKVCMLGDLGDGRDHLVPSRMTDKQVPAAERWQRNPTTGRLDPTPAYIKIPEFDLDHIHRIELKPELPRIPKKLPGMSAAHHEKLCDIAYEAATEAKAYNDRIRQKVYHYVDEGTLTLVSDPFDTRDDDVIEGLTDIESEAATKVSKPAPTATKTVKPQKKAA